MLTGLTEDEQRLKDFDFKWGKKSTYYLGKMILGYDFDELPHRGICKFVDELQGRKRELLLDPRGCFKTTVVSRAYPVRRIIENPNIRILLDSVALTNSVNNLKVVRRHFEENEKLKELYGDFCGKMENWNNSEFTVAARTDTKLAQATVTASGIDKIQIGTHYDLIVADDLHDEHNWRTVEQLRKVKEHIRLLLGLLEPKTGELLIAGHRWSYSDAYTMVMGETDIAEEREFSKIFAGNIYKHGAVNADGTPYFPRVLDHEALAAKRVELGLENFSAMLLNEPVTAGENQIFESRNFKRFKEPLQERPDGKVWKPRLNWGLTIDPGGRKKGNDPWVIFEGAMDAAQNQYFNRYIKKVMKTSVAAELVYQWWLWRMRNGTPYQVIGFETGAQQGQMFEDFKEFIWLAHAVKLPLRELVHSEESKAERIESMAPYYQNGKIYHSAQMGEAFGLEDEEQHFPKGADNIADAASMLREVLKAPRVVVDDSAPASLDEMIKREFLRRDAAAGDKRVRRVHPILGDIY